MGSPLKLLRCGECLIHSAVVLKRMRRAQDVPFPPPSPVSLFGRNCADEDDFELPEEIKPFLTDETLENELTAQGIAPW